MTEEVKSRIKMLLREEQLPFFSDDEIEFYYNENNGDVDATLYQMLLLKSEDTTLSVSGLTTTSTSQYFKRLAANYMPHNSGILK